MLRNPQYSGYTNIIIARLNEIKQMQAGAQAQQQQPPTVAQQVAAPQQQPAQQQPAPQAMASGGIVAFKHGGKVRKFAEGGGTLGYTTNTRLAGIAEDDPDLYAVPAVSAHPEMEHPVSRVRSGNPLSMVDPYQQELAAAIEASKRKPTGIKAVAKAGDAGKDKTDAPKEKPKTAKEITSEIGQFPSYSVSAGVRASNPVGGVGDEEAAYRRITALMNGGDDVTKIDRGEIGRQANQAPWMGLMRAGLGMASEAGKHPWEGILGNLATGAGEGLTDYTKQSDAAHAQNLALSQEQRRQNQGIATLAVQERGQDARLARQLAAANMQASNALKPGMIPYQMAEAAAKRKYTADAKAGTTGGRPYDDYLHDEVVRFVPAMYGSDNTAAARTAAAESVERTKFMTTMMQQGMNSTEAALRWDQQRQAATGATTPTQIRL
jgi:hypothetical protein